MQAARAHGDLRLPRRHPNGPRQHTVARMFVSPRAAGDSLNGALGGPQSSQSEAMRVPELTKCSTSTGSRLEAGEVHDGLDENGVVADVGVLPIQLRERTEERAAAGDVHLAHGPLKGGGSDVGAKGVDDVLPVALVQQH